VTYVINRMIAWPARPEAYGSAQINTKNPASFLPQSYHRVLPSSPDRRYQSGNEGDPD
jgi:hypothetical protein